MKEALKAGQIANFVRSVVPPRLRPIGYLTCLVRERTRCMVNDGPFRGMRYVQVSHGSAYIPKLLGIYERELAQCIETAVSLQPRLVIDIGAAEGYYAVGMARRLPQAQIVAFEMEAPGRKALHELAQLNAVEDRITVGGKCEPADLQRVLAEGGNALVICDVEGYEEKLLDPVQVPALRHALILVELHDFLIPNITELLSQRFVETHRITQIWQETRSRIDFLWRTVGTMLLPQSYLDWAVSEWRPVRMAWLWMEPKG